MNTKTLKEKPDEQMACQSRLVRNALPGKVPLYMAPVGLFDYEGELCLKTEYCTEGRPDAYIVQSGEYFWGGVTDVDAVNNLKVMPLSVANTERRNASDENR